MAPLFIDNPTTYRFLALHFDTAAFNIATLECLPLNHSITTGEQFMLLASFTRGQEPRNSRRASKSPDRRVSAQVEQLESRRLLSAVNDSVTIPANQTSITFNVLNNDTAQAPMLWEVTEGTFGMVTFYHDGTVNYTFGRMTKSLADYTAANNNANNMITDWQTGQIAYITAYYDATSAAIAQFGSYLNSWPGAISTLGGLAADAGGLGNNTYTAAGAFALNLVATAYAENLQSNFSRVRPMIRAN
jgi:hypothetical protein